MPSLSKRLHHAKSSHSRETMAHRLRLGCQECVPDYHLTQLQLTCKQVSPRLDVPLNAVICSTTIACLLSLINIGSTVAFNSLISLTNGTLMVSYGMCIGCFVWRRLSKQPMLPSQFQLGRYGLLVNLLALSFLSVVFVMVSEIESFVRSPDLHLLIGRQAFFPPTPLPTLTVMSMNWSSLVFTVVAVWGIVFYLVWARFRYSGPVEYVRKLD